MDWTAVSAIATCFGTGIVAWYTWETHNLRKLGQEQVTVSQKHLNVLAAGAQPHFTFEFPSTLPILENNELNIRIENSNGNARHIKVLSDDVNCVIQRPYLSNKSGDHQHWRFSPKNPELSIQDAPFQFQISYEDLYGIINLQTFKRLGRDIEKVV